MKQKIVIIVCGPTASGKTDRAIELAQKFQTKIISADSRQCFKELNIGVAKPNVAQLAAIQHYFINSHSVFDDVNAAVFEQYALDKVSAIFKKNDVAVMVGGTGLYIKAFAEGLDEIPVVSASIKEKIEEDYNKSGIEWLREKIKKEDPLFFESGEIKNPHRLMRALAIKQATGKSIKEFQKGSIQFRNFKIQYVYLDPERGNLYGSINQRVDSMMDAGLLDEAKILYRYKHLNALQTVGYKELFDFFENKVSLAHAIENIKKNTRHYAKRQQTWFKKYLAGKVLFQ